MGRLAVGAVVAVAGAWFVFQLLKPDAEGSSDPHRLSPVDVDGSHIERGHPKTGHTYFFSIGDFGSAYCQMAFAEGQLDENGFDGHWDCPAGAQRRTAEVMARLGKGLKPSSIVSLGDNFYFRGVKDLDDPHWNHSFENVYNLDGIADVPWKIMLGDHDHRGNVTALLKHSDRSKRWSLPSLYYRFEVPVPGGSGRAVEVVVSDSVCLEGGSDPELVRTRRFSEDYSDEFVGPAAAAEHWKWLTETLKSGKYAARVVFAHRPLVSTAMRPRKQSETQVSDRVHELLVSAARETPILYAHGHDHVMQAWKDKSRQMAHVGCGAGGMGMGSHPLSPPSRELQRGAELQWAGNTQNGFLVHELGQDVLNTYFIGADEGRVLHSVSLPLASA